MDSIARTHDEWIVLRCQSGDPDGFEALVEEMSRPLLYYATKLTGNSEAAVDIVQDVWIRVFRSIGRLKNPGSLRPWLYRIAHGVAVDRIRQEISREKAEEVHCEDYKELAEPLFDGFDAAALHEGLNNVTLKQREVLVLHFLEDFSIAEIAQILGYPEGTVKSRLHYAKKALKEILLRGGYVTTK